MSFADSPAGERFFQAYDRVLAKWPVPVDQLELTSVFGTTHVLASGPADAPALVLLPGGGATSTVWFAAVADLSRDHRVYAVDVLGDAGRSRADGTPIATREHLTSWLDSVLDELGLLDASVIGHSYGAWIALSYALHAPGRVRSLVLVDPTQCFAGMRAGYLLRAIPLFVRPTAGGMRRLLRWESAGGDLDPDWLELAGTASGDFPRGKVVAGPRPEPERLAACRVPTLVLLAGRSRVHDLEAVAAGARQLMPRAVVTTLTGVSHHQLPVAGAAQLDREILAFLG